MLLSVFAGWNHHQSECYALVEEEKVKARSAVKVGTPGKSLQIGKNNKDLCFYLQGNIILLGK